MVVLLVGQTQTSEEKKALIVVATRAGKRRWIAGFQREFPASVS